MSNSQSIRMVSTPTIQRCLLGLLLLISGLVYAWGIQLNYIHTYYGPAVYSMSQDWSSFFWGSWDGSTITLDKLPAAFWIQALSARLFGFNQWSVLMPGVLEAVACNGLVYLIINRILHNRWYALAGATLMSCTPILGALSHTEISDTLYTMLTLCAVWAWVHIFSSTNELRWLMLTGLFIGCAFHAKMAQAWGILPALALSYFFFHPSAYRRKIFNLFITGLITIFSSLFYIIIASLIPAQSRPWIDGSTENSAWTTVFVYNLLGRYEEGDSSKTGWAYLLDPNQASQAGWLYPAAAIGILATLYYTNKVRSLHVMNFMCALWVAVYWIAFSVGQVNHNYYVVILAPALIILTVCGVYSCIHAYMHEQEKGALYILLTMLISTIAWAGYISRSFSSFYSWLLPASIVLALLAAIFLLLSYKKKTLLILGSVLMLCASIISPAVWTASASTEEYSGSARGPVAGPASGMSGRGGSGGNSSTRSSRSSNSTKDTESTLAWIRANDPGSEYDLVILGYSAASPYILAGARVISVGGYSGSIPNYTLEDLQADIAAGKVHYVLLGSNKSQTDISTWVKNNCTETEYGVYRCV